MAVIVVRKPLGWTPLQVVDDIRAQDAHYRDSKMVYAGRLDPMAEGLIVILTDEDRFNLDEYLKKDKSYTATILFGFKSDSLDALGVVERVGGLCLDTDPELVESSIYDLVGSHDFELPIYSAYKIQGKPLHWWAQHGRIGEIVKPKKNMTVHDARVIKTQTRKASDGLLDVERTVGLVSGDFRQDEVVASWHSALDGVDNVLVATVEFDVTSGTYIRTLVDHVGDQLGCGALLLHLDRTRVGEFEDVGEY